MAVTCRWGSQLDFDSSSGSGLGAGSLRDRHGELIARWQGERMWLRGAPGRELTVEPTAPGDEHPVFGRCLQLLAGGQPRSRMGAVSWAAPRTIPPVAEPARLPPLTGTMLLDILAHCAAAAGVPELRYVGPYPTPALFASLSQCFTPRGDEAAFTAAAADLLLAPRMAEAPVAFAPAPFERWWPSPQIGVQARERIERVFVDGASFERTATALRRLVERPRDDSAASHLAAELWFGDTRWATLAELSPDGALLRGPLPLPPIDDPIVGQELPLPLRRALASLIADAVPAPLAPLVAPILDRALIRWGDAGTSAVRPFPDGATAATLHAALWLTLRPHGPARLALAIAEALTPWVTAEAVRSRPPGE